MRAVIVLSIIFIGGTVLVLLWARAGAKVLDKDERLESVERQARTDLGQIAAVQHELLGSILASDNVMPSLTQAQRAELLSARARYREHQTGEKTT